MSMNFSTMQSIGIPEGSVTKILDESGAVIWSKDTDVTQVTVVLSNSIQATYQGVKVNGTMLTEAGQSANVPLGTVIEIYGYQGVWENGVAVGNNLNPGDYVNYTVQYNISISFSGNGVVGIIPD